MMFRSFLDYQEELELRVPAHSDNIFAALPRKYRCSGRVGRGGRIVVDRFPVRNISALTCIFFFVFVSVCFHSICNCLFHLLVFFLFSIFYFLFSIFYFLVHRFMRRPQKKVLKKIILKI